MLQSLESDEKKQEVGEFLQELSWISRNSNVLIDEGTMFWRERNQLPRPMEDEEDSVLLIMLWDKVLMRQKVLLELVRSWQISEAEETEATSYWSVATTQGTQEGKRQERPVITIDSDLSLIHI